MGQPHGELFWNVFKWSLCKFLSLTNEGTAAAPCPASWSTCVSELPPRSWSCRCRTPGSRLEGLSAVPPILPKHKSSQDLITHGFRIVVGLQTLCLWHKENAFDVFGKDSELHQLAQNCKVSKLAGIHPPISFPSPLFAPFALVQLRPETYGPSMCSWLLIGQIQ